MSVDIDDQPSSNVSIELAAVNLALGHNRMYRIDLSQDLFGHWIVETRWGRAGARGITQIRSFSTAKKASSFAATQLRRRQSAPRRIGTPYIVRVAHGIPCASDIQDCRGYLHRIR